MISISEPLKIAVLYGPLLTYRIDLFNVLSRFHRLTVFATTSPEMSRRTDFAVRVVPAISIGGVSIQPRLRALIARGDFDVCIVFLDPRNVTALSAILMPLTPRVLTWGAWLTDSRIANWTRLAALSRSQADIFYCYEHLRQFEHRGADVTKMYVAQNTVAVPTGPDSASASGPRDSIVFVGSLTRRKGLNRLLRIFKMVLPQVSPLIRLVIVGDGPERTNIEREISRLDLQGRVRLMGRVEDSADLTKIYSRALVSVSLNQAGLTVLQSMGYGVPFVTVEGSISGGETYNITNGVNGYLVEDCDAAIAFAILNLLRDEPSRVSMGLAAKQHYLRYATIEHYAQGFLDAIDGTRRCPVWRGPGKPREQQRDTRVVVGK